MDNNAWSLTPALRTSYLVQRGDPTRWWVLVSNPTLPSFDSATSFLCHLPLQLPMKSIGAINGGGCGSGVGSVTFYATAGVSTPPFARLRTTHQFVSPAYTCRG